MAFKIIQKILSIELFFIKLLLRSRYREPWIRNLVKNRSLTSGYGSRQKSCQAIKALHPSSLMAFGTFFCWLLFQNKVLFSIMARPFLPPPPLNFLATSRGAFFRLPPYPGCDSVLMLNIIALGIVHLYCTFTFFLIYYC